MSDGRLATDIWVRAHLRRWNSEGFPAVLLRRGDPDGGAILLRIIGENDSCRILTQVRDIDGAQAWMTAVKDNAGNAEVYVERALKRDPDLWIIEIEDRRGIWQFDGKIVK